MAKRNGLGMAFHLDGFDLSGDTRSLDEVVCPMTPFDMTGIIQEAYERTGGQLTGRCAWTSFWNVAADRAHDALSTLPLTNRIATGCIRTTIGSPAFALQGKQINYDGARNQAGEFVLTVGVDSDAYPLDWGTLVTQSHRIDTAATNGAGVDFGAAGTFGLQAYLQVHAFTGTDVTIKLQESSDNGVGDAFTDVTDGAFTALTVAGKASQRVQTGRTAAIERYLRVVTTTSAGFTSLDFTVMVNVNQSLALF